MKFTLKDGLRIARDCGFGFYNIDLLLEQARLQMVRGDSESALDDLHIALDAGILANEQT